MAVWVERAGASENPWHEVQTLQSLKGTKAGRVVRALAVVPYTTDGDPADSRVHLLAVAGPSALLVAKLHQLAERINEPKRLKPGPLRGRRCEQLAAT